MKRVKGITLIALVVTIIVMLILAGVSLAAIGGDNGLIKRAMDTAFIQEMTTVQEAFDMWKMAHYGDSRVPTDGIVQAEAINENGRIYGEIAYYRRWAESESGERPEVDVSNKNCFDEYEGDLLVIPRGVEDLYYLSNEELGINNNKQYIIDAANSMIYRVSGYKTNDVYVHSLAMYKEVTIGSVDINFEPAEVDGSGDNIKYAGEEYYRDKDGNYVDANGNIIEEANKVTNPYGFQIISSFQDNNVYKLYNNGELWGKGLKGPTLNTSQEKMDEIDQYVWNDFNVPSIIPGADSGNVKIFPKDGTMFVIDENNYLWAWGNNDYNCLGLSMSELNEYNGKTPVKLKITNENKKVKNVFKTYDDSAFVITESNELYACGSNNFGQLGLGRISSQEDTWQKVNVPDVDKIKKIDGHYGVLITYEKDDGEKMYYFAGLARWIINQTDNQTTFIRVLEGMEDEIQDVYCAEGCVYIFKKDGTVLHNSNSSLQGGPGTNSFIEGNQKEGIYNILDPKIAKGYEMICSAGWSACLLRKNDDGEQELWAVGNESYTNAGLTINEKDHKMHEIEIPAGLKKDGIKEMYSGYNGYFLLSEKGEVWVLGNYACLGINKAAGSTVGIEKTNLKNIKTMYSDGNLIKNQASMNSNGPTIFVTNVGKMIATGEKDITFGTNVYEKNWVKIADNVQYFDSDQDRAGYIDVNHDLYVAGNDSRRLGLGEKSVNSQVIQNYTKVTDENIAGKAKEVQFGNNNIFVLTLDGKLYASGLASKKSVQYRLGGWEEDVDQTEFVEILKGENIEYFSAGNAGRLALTKEGKGYAWGTNYGGALGVVTSAGYPESPVEYNLPSEIMSSSNPSNILKLQNLSWVRTNILTKDGKFYRSGNWANNTYDGGKNATNYFSLYEHENLNLDTDEKIVDVVASDDSNVLILTSKGKLYGFGRGKYLGINKNSTDFVPTQKITIKDSNGVEQEIVQISAGLGYFIAISKNGKVFGTGDNSNGVLGRWLGSDRTSPNSRYRTAYEWVECPELEL